MASLITKYGILNYPKSKDQFENLTYSIIEQQLSGKAAKTIYNRFLALFPEQKFTPQLILDLKPEQIRAVGTSWAKASYLHDLAQKVLDKTLDLANLEKMTDEEMISHLTQVKGIGRWSAEMQLMFSFHRPDILPLDDTGIQNAFVKLYGFKKDKTLKNTMLITAEPWRPYRTLACWYLWRSLDEK